MDKSDRDKSGDSIRDSVPVTARLLDMQADAFVGRENLVDRQMQDMQYQKRMDRPTGPISRLLGKPVLFDDSKDNKALADSNKILSVSDSRNSTNSGKQNTDAPSSDLGIHIVDANISKAHGRASFEELFPNKKDDVFKAQLEKMYPKGIPYKVLASGRKVVWVEVDKTVTDSPTQGREFEPQTPTTNSAVRG